MRQVRELEVRLDFADRDLPGLAVFERPYRCIPKSPVLRGDPNVGGPVSRIPYALLETNLWRISKEDWESYWSTLLDKEVWLLEAKNCTRYADDFALG